MSGLEWIAAGLGLINITLIIRRSVWNYAFGIVMVTLYFFVFFQAKLYSDALLQVFFLFVQIYGWREWLQAQDDKADAVPVRWLPAKARIWWFTGAAAGSVVWGMGMARFTDAAAPVTDAIIAGFSVAAQILLSHRRVENWILWILVNVVAVVLFFSRGLYPTAGLYAIFLIMAGIGLWRWAEAAPRPAK